MIFQVSSLMWLRTTMNYQFKNGGNTLNTIKLLYKDGGFLRFYRGYSFALMLGTYFKIWRYCYESFCQSIFSRF